MKKIFAMIAALLIALLGMSTMAVAEGAFVGSAPVVEEIVFVEAPAVEETPAEEEHEVAPVAIVEAMDFTLKFVNWNNEEILSTLLVEGETVEEPLFASPVREGFTFEHWYDVKDEEQSAFQFGNGIDKNLELRPFFTQDPVAVVEIEDEMVIEPEEDLEKPDAQAQTPAGAVETIDIADNNIDGLEIVIIKDPELDDEETAEEGAVLIEEDEEDEMLILKDEDMEEMTMEDEEVPLAGPPMVAIDRQVNVRSSLGACVNENETVTLMGELIGFDGCNVSMQWQVFDGANWLNIDGANDAEYSFAATNESVNSSYRLAVAING